MDYFFWDEIFGGRQAISECLADESSDPVEVSPEVVSVIIAYVETFNGPQNG